MLGCSHSGRLSRIRNKLKKEADACIQKGSVPRPALRLGRVARPLQQDRPRPASLSHGSLTCLRSRAREPAAFAAGDPRVTRLFPDYRNEEEAYFRKTGIFPIMHVIAMRREIFDANRWVAQALLKAFEEAKARSLVRLSDITASHAPLPWLANYVSRTRALFGDDLWPYGIEPNRKVMETLIGHALTQGIITKPMSVEDLFVPSTRTLTG